MSKPKLGTVYLIHFERPHKHARHYIGFTRDKTADRRIEEHRGSRGACLMRVVNKAGIAWALSRVWLKASRSDGRKLKNRKNASKLCPVCAGRLPFGQHAEATYGE